MFSSKNLIIFGLKFRCLNHLSLFFCMVFENVLILLYFFMWLSSVSAPFNEETVSSPLYIFAFFVRVHNHRCVWVYLYFLSCTIDRYFCFFVTVPFCHDYCSIVVLSLLWKAYASSFVLLLQYCFGNSGSFVGL